MIETTPFTQSQPTTATPGADPVGALFGPDAQDHGRFASLLAERRTERQGREQARPDPAPEPRKQDPATKDERKSEDAAPLATGAIELVTQHRAELRGEISLSDRATAELGTADEAPDQTEPTSSEEAGAAPARTRDNGRTAERTPQQHQQQKATGDAPRADPQQPRAQDGPDPDRATSTEQTQAAQSRPDAGAHPTAITPGTPAAKNDASPRATGAVASVAAGAKGPTQNAGAGGRSAQAVVGASGFREVMSRIGAKSGQPQIMRAEAQFAAHASRAMVQTVREGRTEVILRLRPETLGPVKIELSMEDGRMNARMESSNPAARELLGASLDHLRGALEARGLSVDRIEVVAPAESEGAQAGGADPQQHGGSSAGEHGRREDHGASRESVGEPAAEPWGSGAAEPAGMWTERGADGASLLRVDATV